MDAATPRSGQNSADWSASQYFGILLSAQPLHAEDDATHLLYGEIMRETDNVLRRSAWVAE